MRQRLQIGMLARHQRFAAEEEGRGSGSIARPYGARRRKRARHVGDFEKAVDGSALRKIPCRAFSLRPGARRARTGVFVDRHRSQHDALMQHLVVLEAVQQRVRERRRCAARGTRRCRRRARPSSRRAPGTGRAPAMSSRICSRWTRRPTRQVSIRTNTAAAMASGSQPPCTILSELEDRKARSINPSEPNTAITTAGRQCQRCTATMRHKERARSPSRR